ncbi:MAG TPA: peptidase S10 [Roseiflexaceae bacterium]|nr:peptidase S10 [Roseiflexaceae bacterium]
MADEPKNKPTPDTAQPADAPAKPLELPDEPPIQRRHELRLGDTTLAYYTTTGTLLLKSEAGETEAQIFFVAYTLNAPEGDTQRPLIFMFNGGPGAASIYLHMGAFSPRRARLNDDGTIPPPPYQLLDNQYTLLQHADLVYVDPVGTGFSRAAKEELHKKFWSVKGDIEALSEFIRLYLNRYGRMTSPLFVCGESYGTFRAAGLADHLLTKNIALSGLILVSAILNFQASEYAKGNDLPYALLLPTFTAAAWYHHKLPADLQDRPLREAMAEAERWAVNDYTLALMRGDLLSEEERAQVIERLARYTGLEPRYLERSNLRIRYSRFIKELLRDQRRSVSAYDARLTNIDELAIGEEPDFDVILSVLGSPYTMLLNDYVRKELGYTSDREYHTLSMTVNQAWDFGKPLDGWPDTSAALRSAMSKNAYMRVFVARGIYDFATSYFAIEYTMNHLGLDPSLRGNIRYGDYESGHMIYIDLASLARLKQDVADFLLATPA